MIPQRLRGLLPLGRPQTQPALHPPRLPGLGLSACWA